MNETLNEIMESVAIHKKMVDLRDRAKTQFESDVSCSVNNKLSLDPGKCNQHVINLHAAYRIYRVLNILLERGKKDDQNNSLDRIYFELKNQF